MKTKHEMVQVPNPKTRRWAKIDKTAGSIISYKKSPGCYKGVPIANTVKCDCGHEKRDHYLGEGQCHWLDSTECGCTWFHPEAQYCKPLRMTQRVRIAFVARAGQRPPLRPKGKTTERVRIAFLAHGTLRGRPVREGKEG